MLIEILLYFDRSALKILVLAQKYITFNDVDFHYTHNHTKIQNCELRKNQYNYIIYSI